MELNDIKRIYRDTSNVIICEGIDSSSIKNTCFDLNSQILTIEFPNNKIYAYLGVPESLFKRFINSESKGKFFHQHIRGQFDYDPIK